MRLATALVWTGLLAVPVAARTQPVGGFYIGAGAGYNVSQDQDVHSLSGPAGRFATPGAQARTGGGPMMSASVGYGFGNGLRLELQGGYRNYHQRLAGNLAGAPRIGSGALNQTYGAFANALLDLDVGLPFVVPYIGAGLGYEQTSMSVPLKSASDGSVAAQFILGAAAPVPHVDGLSVTAEYRLMATLTDERFAASGYAGKLSQQFNHAVLLGVRYALNAPTSDLSADAPLPVANVADAPEPAAPAPRGVSTPVPARTYLVFFDWDRADLSASTRDIIGEAARAAARVKLTRIEVAGHADRSGTPSTNQTLSQARADAVAGQLMRLGVLRSEITVTAFGDTHPLVATAPGARDPQNRRVEIVLK